MNGRCAKQQVFFFLTVHILMKILIARGAIYGIKKGEIPFSESKTAWPRFLVLELAR